MHFYRLAGLAVASEISLPGAIVAPPPGAAAQIAIRFGPVPTDLENPGASGPTWAMSGDDFLLRVPGVARFLMRDGRSIDVELETGATIEDAAPFLAGTAFGVLLHQRKLVLLHASAICVEGAAVLFCGPSGAGKSTLAAALDQRGYPFVTDDFCAVAVDRLPPTVHPDGRLLKLWAHSVDELALSESRGGAVRNRLQKFYIEPRDAACEPLPLRALYVLRDDRLEKKVHISRANVVDAALSLRQCAYRPQIVSRFDQEGLYLQASAAIAATAGVFLLRRPMEFSAMAEVIGRLEDEWREAGSGRPPQ